MVGKATEDYARQSAKEMRKRLLEKIFILGPGVVQTQGTGNLVTLTLDGIFQVENYIKLLLSKMMSMAIVPVLILLVDGYHFWDHHVIGISLDRFIHGHFGLCG